MSGYCLYNNYIEPFCFRSFEHTIYIWFIYARLELLLMHINYFLLFGLVSQSQTGSCL
jgi:hypothetical protein